MIENKFTLHIFSSITNEYKQLDLDDTSDMLTIFSVENIADISARKDNITKDLVLKGTDNNNQALGNLYDISRYSSDTYPTDLSHNFVPNKQIKCILLENQIQVMGGSLGVRNIKIDNNNITYECAIIGSLVSFFGRIKDQSLDKVNYGNIYYTWNWDSIQQSWSNGSDILYPTIDYGIDERVGDNINTWDSTYDIKNFRPALRLTKYLSSIFSGYTLDTSRIDTIIKDVVIPFNEEYLLKEFNYQWGTVTMPSYTYTSNLERISSFGRGIDSGRRTYSGNSKYFNTGVLEVYNPVEGAGNNPNTPYFELLDSKTKAPINFTYQLTLRANQTGTFTSGLVNIKDSEKINKSTFLYSQTINKTTSASQVYNVSVDIPDDVTLDGKYIFAIFKEGANNLDFAVNQLTMRFGGQGKISKVEITEGDQFTIKEVVPKDVKVMEFLKSVMTMFNLYLISDPSDDSKFILDTYSNYYKDTIQLNRSLATDWTSKVDFTNYSISTNINLPMAYKFTMSEDSDMLTDKYKNTWNEVYGQHVINDSQGTAEQKEQTVIFAPSINIQHSQDEKLMPVIYKADGYLTGKKKAFKSKIRIMYLVGRKYTKEAYQLTYRGQNYLSPIGLYGYASMIDAVNDRTLLFDLPREYFTKDDIQTDDTTTLYTKYHQQQIRDLTDPNLIIFEAKAYLHESDISNLDMSKPIYLQSQYGNSYFKILEVEYINSVTPATIKLQKIVLS
ncbi:hypothetical protein [Sphingobacterium chungjuense]|uniref:hypothetical protein n=1 Tax=Sphingobacterium chungjuense TaxID=2675553 RepID=UPI001407FE6B|nr:hypothetical protein [Sphingobacterium chungjuense]